MFGGLRIRKGVGAGPVRNLSDFARFAVSMKTAPYGTASWQRSPAGENSYSTAERFRRRRGLYFWLKMAGCAGVGRVARSRRGSNRMAIGEALPIFGVPRLLWNWSASAVFPSLGNLLSRVSSWRTRKNFSAVNCARHVHDSAATSRIAFSSAGET